MIIDTKQQRKLHLGERFSLVGVVMSSVVGSLSAVVKDRYEATGRAKMEREIAFLQDLSSRAVRQSSVIATELSGGSLAFALHIPCKGRFEAHCHKMISGFDVKNERMTYTPAPHYKLLSNNQPHQVYVYVGDNPMPRCDGICSPSGLVNISGLTRPSDWSMEVHVEAGVDGRPNPEYILVTSDIRKLFVSSFGPETPSLESLRGRYISVALGGEENIGYVSGVELRTSNGQSVSIGSGRLKVHPLGTRLVAEFKFPSDVDPRRFVDYIYQ